MTSVSMKGKYFIYRIIKSIDCNGHLLGRGYATVELKEEISAATLFQKLSPPATPKWIQALASIVRDPLDLDCLRNRTASFVLFLEEGHNTYAICGGSGGIDIQQFIDSEFGLDIVVRVIPPSAVKLKRLKGITGSISQIEEVYKGNYNYELDPRNWGRIAKELLGDVTQEELRRVLGLDLSRSRGIKLHGKGGFSINRSLSLNDIRFLVNRFERILRKQPKFNILKGYSEVTDKAVKRTLSEQINADLINHYNSYCTRPDEWSEQNVGISAGEMRDVLQCTEFSMTLKGQRQSIADFELGSLFEKLHGSGVTTLSKSYIDQIRIIGSDDDGNEIIAGSLRHFICAETQIGDKVYACLEGRWFVSTAGFIEQVDQEFDQVLTESAHAIAAYGLPTWNLDASRTKTESEDEYIDRICDKTNMLKFHRNHVIIDGNNKTEFCDVFDIRNKNSILVFIKRGFGANLRELFAQARSSGLLYMRDERFRADAQAKIADVLKSTPSDIRRPALVMAFTDHALGRQHTPLKERLTTMVKIDMIETYRYLKRDADFGIALCYEIAHS